MNSIAIVFVAKCRFVTYRTYEVTKNSCTVEGGLCGCVQVSICLSITSFLNDNILLPQAEYDLTIPIGLLTYVSAGRPTLFPFAMYW